MIPITQVWLVFTLMCLGAGYVIYHTVCKLAKPTPDSSMRSASIFSIYLMGLCWIVLVLQIYNLFLPVNIGLKWFVWGLSGLGTLGLCNSLWSILKKKMGWFQIISGIAFLALSVVMCSYRATFSIWFEDTWLYHQKAVRWISEYPAVFGLVNLDFRLGLVSSVHLLAALQESVINPVLQHKYISAAHLITGSVTYIFFAKWLHTILADFKESRLVRVYCLFSLTLIIHYIFGAPGRLLASLNTDIVMDLSLLGLCKEMLSLPKGFWKIKKEEEWLDASWHYLMIIMLGITLLTMKSNSMFTGILSTLLIIPVLIGFIKSEPKYHKKLSLSLVLLLIGPSMLGLGLLARNVIITGWMIFPFPYLGNLGLDWSISEYRVNFRYHDAMNWGRRFKGADYSKLNDFTYWFWPWLKSAIHSRTFQLIIFGLTAIGITLIKPIKKHFWDKDWLQRVAPLFVAFIGLSFIILTSAHLRYAQAYIWAFFAIAAAILTSRLPLVVNIALVIGLAVYTDNYQYFRHLHPINLTGVYPSFRAPINRFTPNKNMPMHMPEKRGLCGNHPPQILCTPDPDSKLELRVSGNLRYGFKSTCDKLWCGWRE